MARRKDGRPRGLPVDLFKQVPEPTPAAHKAAGAVCPACDGSGVEVDLNMSIVMGEVVGCGFLPMTQPCQRCAGKGRVVQRG